MMPELNPTEPSQEEMPHVTGRPACAVDKPEDQADTTEAPTDPPAKPAYEFKADGPPPGGDVTPNAEGAQYKVEPEASTATDSPAPAAPPQE